MKLKKGDNVLVIAGKDRGRSAKILRSLPKEGKIIVDGMNLKRKHVKPKREGEKGQVVPVPAAVEGVDALVQGRADVTFFSLNGAKVREADAAVGVRHLTADCSPEGDKRVRQAVPGYYTRILKAGTAMAVVEDTCVVAFDLYLTTYKGLPDPVVATVLKAIWENIDKLPPFHPTFKDWTRERAVSADVTIPYHPGAIKFYKEQGAWKSEMDQVQQKLLAVNP